MWSAHGDFAYKWALWLCAYSFCTLLVLFLAHLPRSHWIAFLPILTHFFLSRTRQMIFAILVANVIYDFGSCVHVSTTPSTQISLSLAIFSLFSFFVVAFGRCHSQCFQCVVHFSFESFGRWTWKGRLFCMNRASILQIVFKAARPLLVQCMFNVHALSTHVASIYDVWYGQNAIVQLLIVFHLKSCWCA